MRLPSSCIGLFCVLSSCCALTACGGLEAESASTTPAGASATPATTSPTANSVFVGLDNDSAIGARSLAEAEQWRAKIAARRKARLAASSGSRSGASVAHPDGYSTFDDSFFLNNGPISIRLQPGLEPIRSQLESAAFSLSFITGRSVTVAAGTVDSTTPAALDEIRVELTSASPCIAPWAACGAPAILGSGQIVGGHVWVQPFVMNYADHDRQHVAFHELGHAFGLDHTDQYNGVFQVMSPGNYTAADYQAGDVNGLTYTSRAMVPFGALDAAIFNGTGFQVSGWAADPYTSAAIDVHVYAYDSAGNVAAAKNLFRANLYRADVGAAYPAFGSYHGYSSTIDFGAEGTYNVCAFGISTVPNRSAQLGCRSVTVAVNPFGALDVADWTATGLHVYGWAIDPNTSAPIDVHVYVYDGTGAAVASKNLFGANVYRPDVGAVYPGFGAYHGFDQTFPVTANGAFTACAYGINAPGTAGVNIKLGCKAVTVSGNPFGALDVVTLTGTGVRVQGWAIDPDTTAPIELHVLVGGKDFAATANSLRADVGSAYPGYGNNHGFDTTVPFMTDGTYNVCIVGSNRAGLGLNTQIACRSLTIKASPFGNYESVNKTATGIRVTGWIIDPDTTAPANVLVAVDSAWFPANLAQGLRADVGAAYPGYGNYHGFDATVPYTTPGTHNVCAWAINVAGTPGVNVALGCRSLTY